MAKKIKPQENSAQTIARWAKWLLKVIIIVALIGAVIGALGA